MLKLTSQLLFLNLCVYVCVFQIKATGLRWLLLLQHASSSYPSSVHSLSRVARAQKPCSGGEEQTAPNSQLFKRASLTPTQKEILISNQTIHPQMLAPSGQNVFPTLGKQNKTKKHTHIRTPIYIIFFVFTFKYKNTILLCVINGGPSNKNFFF